MLNNIAVPKNSPVALITGASGGLGSALSLAFAQAGYRVALHYYRNKRKVQELAATIRRQGRHAEAFQADVGNSAGVERLFKAVSRSYGRLDVLVHAAGNTDPAPIVRMRPHQFDDVLRTHLTGGFLCTRAAARIMKRRKSGFIVHLGSMVGSKGAVGSCNYAAAKAGLTALAKTAARELGPYNICVNVVYPGYMMTQMGRHTGAQFVRAAKRDNVFGRWTDPKDTAAMIVVLCQSPWISGQVLNLDGRIL